MPVKNKARRVVKVVWKDAAAKEDWDHISSLDNVQVLVCETVGFFHKEDKEKIILYRTFSSDEGIEGAFNIPKECVVSKKFLG